MSQPADQPANEYAGVTVKGATWAFQPTPPDIELRNKLREKRKQTKLETMKKRGLLPSDR